MNPRTILVVDDNPTNLKLVSDVLEFEGYEILKAIDAEEGQEIIAAQLPNLILLDIALPGMDGLTFARQLRAEERTRGIRIVALTAFAMVGDEEKARNAGCDGYITKPIDTRTLPKLVAGFLQKEEPPPPKPVLNILVIEDTPSDLKLAQHVLSCAGHLVVGASAAEQAVEAVKRNKPQIILLDMQLGEVNGLDLARALKADPTTRDIHIVAVTSFPERFSEAAALAAGCDAYLKKPLSTGLLPGQIEDVAQRSTTSRNVENST